MSISNQSIIDFVNSWRAINGISGSGVITEDQLAKFAIDLQNKLADVSIAPDSKPNATAIPYTGNSGDTASWRIAKELSESSGGKLFYISDTQAGELMNSSAFRSALQTATGSPTLGDALIDGVNTVDGNRTPYGVKNILAINDYFSKRIMDGATGAIVTVTTTIDQYKVFAQTELPALLENKNITTINGIPRETLVAISNALPSGVADASIRSLMAASSLLMGGTLNVTRDGQVVSILELNIKQMGAGGIGHILKLGAAAVVNDAVSALSKLGAVVGVITMFSAFYEASTEAAAGNIEKAAQIMGEWGAKFLAGLAVGLAAASLTGEALLPLLGAGPLGSAGWLIATTLAGIAGGILGEEAIHQLLHPSNAPEGPTWDSKMAISIAKQDNAMGLAYRRILYQLNPLALLEAAPNFGNALELYNPDTGLGEITEKWIETRSKVLSAYTLYWTRHETDGLLSVSAGIPFSQWGDTIISDAALGNAKQLIIDGWDFGVAGTRYVRFGDENGNTLTGGESDDLLFGGASDDTLNGGKDNDYLEGNSGADSLLGGEGADTLLGGEGDDILSGDEGNDLLDGGEGNDTYRFASGFGSDTIIDSDGVGSIEFDETPLNGGEETFKGSGVWVSEDSQSNKIQYTLVEEGDDTKTLIISRGIDRIRIKNFTEDMLGISLEAGLPPVDTPTTLTIAGDEAPVDTDPVKEGVQYEFDDLGNIVTEGSDPDRKDVLHGSDQADLIQGFGGDDVLNGKAGHDSIEGGTGRDSISGGTDNDVLAGGAESDILIGGADNDRLYAEEVIDIAEAIALGRTQENSNLKGEWLAGGSGDDVLIGSAGNDVLSGGGEADLLIGGAGDDHILGDADIAPTSFEWAVIDESLDWSFVGDSTDGAGDTIYAGKGNDHVWAGTGEDIVYGDGGNDSILGNDGNDTLYGGDGDDYIHGDGTSFYGEASLLGGNDFLDGGEGNDQLVGSDGDDELSGGTGNDTLLGDGDDAIAGKDYLEGGEGNDYLGGGGHDDTLLGGDGIDTLIGDIFEDPAAGQGNDYLDGGKDDDQVLGGGLNDTLFGGEGNDTIWGDDDDKAPISDQGSDYLDGGDGNDWLIGGGIDDTLLGGSGDDELRGDYFQSFDSIDGNDYLDGGIGNDTLRGGSKDDTLYGGAGNDLLFGNHDMSSSSANDNDTLIGGAGDDTLVGNGGNDSFVFNLGDGNDYLIDLAGTNTIVFGGGISLASIKLSAIGEDGVFTLYYSNSDSITIDGLSAGYLNYQFNDGQILTGEDMMALLNDPYSVTASGGDTVMVGGNGADALRGNIGNDTLNGGAGADYLSGEEGRDLIKGGAGNDLIFGYDGDDTLYGGEGADQLVGGAGDDVVYGEAGADRLWGQAGNDTLHGGDGNDELYGGDGIDLLIGGRGDDTLISGGTGSKTYVFNLDDGNDTILATAGIRHVQFGAGIFAADIKMYLSPPNAPKPYILVQYSDQDSILIQLGADTGTLDYQFSDNSLMTHAALAALTTQADSARYAVFGTDGDNSLWAGDYAVLMQGGAGNDQLYGGEFNDILSGGSDNDSLYGSGGNDDLAGSGGNDALDGGNGDDTLHGGAGNDTLFGGTGSDTYIYALGDGSDVISKSSNDGEDVNILRFTDLLASDVIYTHEANESLRIQIKGSADSIEVKNWYSNTPSRLQQIIYADESVLDASLLNSLEQVKIIGQGDAAHLNGTQYGDIIIGTGGNDVIDGKAGNDFIWGGAGEDTYVMRRGMGKDTIYDQTGGANILQLDAGGTFDQLVTDRIDNDLYLHFTGTTDGVLLKDYYAGSSQWLVTTSADEQKTLEQLMVDISNRPVASNVEQLRQNWITSSKTQYVQNIIAKYSQSWYQDQNWTYEQTGPYSIDIIYSGSLGNSVYSHTFNEYEQIQYIDFTNSNYIERISDSSSTIWHEEENEQVTVNLPASLFGVTTDSAQNNTQYVTDYARLDTSGQPISYVIIPGGGMPSDVSAYLYLLNESSYGYGEGSSLSSSITYTQKFSSTTTVFNYEHIVAGPSNNSIYGYEFMSVDGGGGDDYMIGSWGILGGEGPGQFYYGGEGNDFIVGGAADDFIIGGNGDDYLAGSQANDTFHFIASETGSKIVDEASRVWNIPKFNEYLVTNIGEWFSNKDAVEFGSGIALSSLHMRRGQYNSPYDTKFDPNVGKWVDDERIADTIDFSWGENKVVRVLLSDLVDPYADPSTRNYDYGIEFFKFSDGTVLSMAEMLTMVDVRSQNALDLWVRDGAQTITDLDGISTVRFGFGITPDQITRTRAGNDLVLSVNGTGDQWILQEWYADATRVSSVTAEFADGAVWNAAALSGSDDGPDIISGSAADDQLNGSDSSDTLSGGAGNDTLAGGLGDDIYLFNAGDGIDTIVDEGGVDSLQFGEGITQESLTLGIGSLLVRYGAAQDAIHIEGFNPANALGSSVIENFLFADGSSLTYEQLLARGFDLSGSGTITGTSVIDRITGSDGQDTINSGAGNDLLYGLAGDDQLFGDAGDDTLDGGLGADTMTGGAGNDTYLIDTSWDVIVESGGEGVDHVLSTSSYRMGANIENLTMVGAAAITAGGNDLDNVLIGSAADNTLVGGGGADTMTGGTGNDTYYVDNAGDIVIEHAGEGIDLVDASISYVLGEHVEALTMSYGAFNGTGNAADNLLKGNSSNNILNGLGGNDLLQGGAGNDTLTDNTGNNLFDGGFGIDTIIGGVGNEFMAGGAGNDTITTGAGADIIAFNRGDGMDIVNASTGLDNTLSLGKGIKYADLLFKKAASDLVLVTGTNEQITFKNWYAGADNRSIDNLQVVIEGTTDYSASSASQINNKKVQQFDFDGLVAQFDQAMAANPAISSWSLSSSLLAFHLGGSDAAAMGGDLAYRYARNGNLSSLSMTPAQALLADDTFGTAAQNLQSTTALQDLSPRLM